MSVSGEALDLTGRTATAAEQRLMEQLQVREGREGGGAMGVLRRGLRIMFGFKGSCSLG